MKFAYPIINIDDSKTITVYLPDYQKYYSEALMGAWVGSKSRVSLSEDDNGSKWFTVRKTHYEALRKALVTCYGMVYVNATHENLSRCDQRCIEAKHGACSCSCLGMGHGTGNHDWLIMGPQSERVLAQLVFAKQGEYLWLEDSWVEVTPQNMREMYGPELVEAV